MEIFKAKNGLAPSIMGSMFKRRNATYNLRNFQNLRSAKTFRIRSFSVQFECGKIRTRKTPNTDTFYAVFETERKRTVYFVLETLSHRSPQLLSLLPEHMRQINSLDQFKRSVGQWGCNGFVKYTSRM